MHQRGKRRSGAKEDVFQRSLEMAPHYEEPSPYEEIWWDLLPAGASVGRTASHRAVSPKSSANVGIDLFHLDEGIPPTDSGHHHVEYYDIDLRV